MTVDELGEYGMAPMDEAAIRDFLSNRRVGVLALPDDGVPYVFPMSYGFDGDSRLYFTYVLGGESTKGDLSDRAEAARFLVYRVDTAFNWQSVLLTGTLSALPEEEWGSVRGVLDDAWRPDLFERAGAEGTVGVYEFRIEDRTGLKHAGLPPGFAGPDDGPR